jgi:hypothetical protein
MEFNLSELSAYSVIAALVLGCIGDRWLLARAAVTITKVKQHKNMDGMIRFALHYKMKNLPAWSEIRYSLVDKKNPATIISGKTRGLDFSKLGLNAEYLLLREDIVSGGDWELKIKITTVAGRLNPLYSLFPSQTFHIQSLRIAK